MYLNGGNEPFYTYYSSKGSLTEPFSQTSTAPVHYGEGVPEKKRESTCSTVKRALLGLMDLLPISND